MLKQVVLLVAIVLMFASAQHYYDEETPVQWRFFKKIGRAFKKAGHAMGRGFKKMGNTMKDWHDKSRMGQWISFVPGVGAVYDTSLAISRIAKNPKDWRNWTDLGIGAAGFIPGGKAASGAKHATRFAKFAKAAGKASKLKHTRSFAQIRHAKRVNSIAQIRKLKHTRSFAQIRHVNRFKRVNSIAKIRKPWKLQRFKAVRGVYQAPKAFKIGRMGRAWGKASRYVRKSRIGKAYRGGQRWARGVGKRWNGFKQGINNAWKGSRVGRWANRTGKAIRRSRFGKAWRGVGRRFDASFVGRGWNKYKNAVTGNKYLRNFRDAAKWIKRYRGAGNLAEAFGGKRPGWMKLNTRHRFYSEGGFARNWLHGRRG